ncbi:hypothetical protein GCM10010833_13380 [Blastomonas aquatica]|uniref:Uncharacterized protein n=1 Tax=Blastomonas aquatica TaxID=1510276 RepID=A0ABQ1J6I9_9SPHN|nr:hypothetical protein GCM10010833_13380 [Blastomonas aquatica]
MIAHPVGQFGRFQRAPQRSSGRDVGEAYRLVEKRKFYHALDDRAFGAGHKPYDISAVRDLPALLPNP